MVFRGSRLNDAGPLSEEVLDSRPPTVTLTASQRATVARLRVERDKQRPPRNPLEWVLDMERPKDDDRERGTEDYSAEQLGLVRAIAIQGLLDAYPSVADSTSIPRLDTLELMERATQQGMPNVDAVSHLMRLNLGDPVVYDHARIIAQTYEQLINQQVRE